MPSSSAAGEHKRPPSLPLSHETNRLQRETAFNCRIQFRNDLPEIPCDPKILLPAINPRELGAFRLTSLEKELKRDMLFEPDLGIPLAPLSITRYELPGTSHELAPADAELLESDDEKSKPSGAPEVSWLLRTSYLTSGHQSADRPAAKAASDKLAAAAAPAEDIASRVAAIEDTFQAAAEPPRHATNPELTAEEVLPIFPDEEHAGQSFVLALFDSNPLAETDRLARLDPGQLAAVKQAVQLKSFAQRRPDGSLDAFVALLLPADLRALPSVDPEGREGLSPAQLQGDYDWVREYDSIVQYDERRSTFLFRRVGGHVGYSDLNTKLVLRKRKRAAQDGERFLQPEKVILRLPPSGDAEEGGDDV